LSAGRQKRQERKVVFWGNFAMVDELSDLCSSFLDGMQVEGDFVVDRQ
jgi:hypothetical protein